MQKRFLAPLIALVITFGIACSQQRANTPSVKDDVKKALDNAHLKDVSVSEDRHKGVVTLSGDVNTLDQKQQAEDIARLSATGMVVANEIGVRPKGAGDVAKEIDKNLDEGIEKNYKVALLESRLNKQDIHFTSVNGTLTIKGTVNTAQQRADAQTLAARVPNVQQVVNELDIKGAKDHKLRASR